MSLVCVITNTITITNTTATLSAPTMHDLRHKQLGRGLIYVPPPCKVPRWRMKGEYNLLASTIELVIGENGPLALIEGGMTNGSLCQANTLRSEAMTTKGYFEKGGIQCNPPTALRSEDRTLEDDME